MSADHAKSYSNHKKISSNTSGSTEKGFVPLAPAFTVEDTLFLNESEGSVIGNFVV